MKAGRTKKITGAESVELRFLEGVRRRLPNNLQVLQALGHLYTRAGRYTEGLAVDLRLVDLQPHDPINWYNLACSCALTGMRSVALASLALAIDLGYKDADWMLQDEDLASLRQDPSFKELVDIARAARRYETEGAQ